MFCFFLAAAPPTLGPVEGIYMYLYNDHHHCHTSLGSYGTLKTWTYLQGRAWMLVLDNVVIPQQPPVAEEVALAVTVMSSAFSLMIVAMMWS